MPAATPAPSLPEDPAALRAMLLAVLEQRDTLAAERDAAVAQNERLLTLLAKLRRMQFGRKSERLPEDQLLFAFEEIEATLAEGAAEAGKHSPSCARSEARRRRQSRPSCRRTCRASSRCCGRRATPARAAMARWWRSAPTPPSGSMSSPPSSVCW